jgi:hypothetical protein
VAAYVDDMWQPTWTTRGCLRGGHVAAYVDDTWLPTWRTHGFLRGRHVAAYVDNDKDADVDFFSCDMSC